MPIDATELAKLITNHAAVLRFWIRGSCQASEDVVQEAFCRLAAQDPVPEKPIPWLYRVCRNLAEKQRRSDHRRRKREQTHAEITAVANDRIDPIDVAETLAAVEKLNPELQEVLVARIWGQLSLDEVGKLCGVSTATAFRRYEAALKALRQLLESNCENQL